MRSLPQRRSPRLRGADYSHEGAYFITICTYERQYLFGYIENNMMILSQLGHLASTELQALSSRWLTIDLDIFVVMPNHVHAIILIKKQEEQQETSSTVTLGRIVNHYKGGVTRQAYQKNLLQSQLWQGRYHDHIIRDEESHVQIYSYILTNPERWQNDVFYAME